MGGTRGDSGSEKLEGTLGKCGAAGFSSFQWSGDRAGWHSWRQLLAHSGNAEGSRRVESLERRAVAFLDRSGVRDTGDGFIR